MNILHVKYIQSIYQFFKNINLQYFPFKSQGRKKKFPSVNTEVKMWELVSQVSKVAPVFKSSFHITWYTPISVIKYRKCNNNNKPQLEDNIFKRLPGPFLILRRQHEPWITAPALQYVQNKKTCTTSLACTIDLSFYSSYPNLHAHGMPHFRSQGKCGYYPWLHIPPISAVIHRLPSPLQC